MQFCTALSRGDLVRTACEQTCWHTPDGGRSPRLRPAPARGTSRARYGAATAEAAATQRLHRAPAASAANFSHSLRGVDQELEALLPQARHLWDTLNLVIEHAARGPQREQRGRSYPQRSRRPARNGGRASPPILPPQTELHFLPPTKRCLNSCASILVEVTPNRNDAYGIDCHSMPLYVAIKLHERCRMANHRHNQGTLQDRRSSEGAPRQFGGHLASPATRFCSPSRTKEWTLGLRDAVREGRHMRWLR